MFENPPLLQLSFPITIDAHRLLIRFPRFQLLCNLTFLSPLPWFILSPLRSVRVHSFLPAVPGTSFNCSACQAVPGVHCIHFSLQH